MSTFENNDEVSLPNFGVLFLSITEAARLIALDKWSSQPSGDIPGMKPPTEFEIDLGYSYQNVFLDRNIKELEANLCTSTESGKLEAASLRRSDDGKIIPDKTFISFNGLCIWLTERGYGPGQIIGDYIDKELWIFSRLRKEVAYLSCRMISLIERPTSPLRIRNRYFGHHTTWYLHSHTACANFLNRLIEYLLRMFRVPIMPPLLGVVVN